MQINAGGKVIINGATLTSLQNCRNSTWEGIIVEGISNQPQTVLPNGYNIQGQCILNNATISNANEAIRLWNPSTWQAGGIVRASSSRFLNNQRSAEFISYQNINSQGLETRNRSFFINCTFTNDRLWGIGHYPIHMVTMWDVFGVTFTGCKFTNALNPLTTDASKYSQGISSLDAGYFIDKYCSQIGPNGECLGITESSKFDGFKQGILATNVDKPYAISVNRTTFKGNQEGIRLDASNNARLTQNIFFQGIFDDNYDWGIKTTNSSKFVIENNLFENVSINLKNTTGIYIEEAGPDANQVYNNTFTNLKIANHADGQNRQVEKGNSSSLTGLKYLCNTMNNSLVNQPTDIWVTPDYDGSAADQGIAKIQGIGFLEPFTAAGNTFTPDCELIGAKHIDNQTDVNIKYYFSNQTIDEQPICYYNVSTLEAQPNECISNFRRLNGIKLTNGEIVQRVASYDVNDNLGNQKLNALKENIDNGNTPDLQSNIQYTDANNANALAQELNMLSPYLSEEALKTLVSQYDLLTLTQLYNLLLLNPEAIQTKEFFELLQNKPDALPQWMIDNIKYNTLNTSVRGINEKEASHYITAAQINALEMAQNYSFDTLALNATAAKEWLEKENDFFVSLQLAEHYISNNNPELANTIISNLNDKFNLENSPKLQWHKQSFDAFENFMQIPRSQNRNKAQLTVEEQISLKNIAENGGIGGQWAENILRFFYKYQPEEKLWQPAAAKTSKQPIAQIDVNKPKSILLTPNPANNQFNVLLTNTLNENVLLEIYDNKGSKILQQNFVNTFNLDCSTWAKNIYYIRVISAKGSLIGTEKILIQ